MGGSLLERIKERGAARTVYKEVGHAPGVHGAVGWCSRRSYENEAVRGVGHEKFCRKRMMELRGLPSSRRRSNA